jgi:hypothetical protein
MVNLQCSCPVCGAYTLHRWYHAEKSIEPRVLLGVAFSALGRLYEWCSSCRSFETFVDALVPQRWNSDLVVLEEFLCYEPGPIEEARIGNLSTMKRIAEV